MLSTGSTTSEILLSCSMSIMSHTNRNAPITFYQKSYSRGIHDNRLCYENKNCNINGIDAVYVLRRQLCDKLYIE